MTVTLAHTLKTEQARDMAEKRDGRNKGVEARALVSQSFKAHYRKQAGPDSLMNVLPYRVNGGEKYIL